MGNAPREGSSHHRVPDDECSESTQWDLVNSVRASFEGDAGSIWLMALLWCACSRSTEMPARRSRTNVMLNIPDIVFFDDGVPRIWICTQNGGTPAKHDSRGSIDKPAWDIISRSMPEETTERNIWDMVVDAMHHFWNIANGSSYPHRRPMCVVRWVNALESIINIDFRGPRGAILKGTCPKKT